MSSKKLLIIWPIILFSLGCSKLPPRPSVYLCTYRVVDAAFLCKQVEGDARKEVPEHEAQGYVAFSPDDWVKVSAYIQELKKLAEKRCK